MRHIVIPCAGMGSRLDRDCPKALVSVCGDIILNHILGSIDPMADVCAHVVTGFKAHLFHNFYGDFPPWLPTHFHHNINWETTGPADSVSLVARQLPPDELITIIDGDIIPDPDSFMSFINAASPMIGWRQESLDPAPIRSTDLQVSGTGWDSLPYKAEWACVATVRANWFRHPDHKSLWECMRYAHAEPQEFIGCEIDTPEMLNHAIEWLSTRQS